MQAYSNPKRESNPYSLPDVEVFFVTQDETTDPMTCFYELSAGWYWWACLPGCLPDSDPIGPFETKEAALADAQSESWQFEDDE